MKLLVALLLILPACAPTEREGREEAASCQSQFPAGPSQQVQGLIAPGGLVVTEVEETSDGGMRVRGFVEKTPVEVRTELEARTGIEVLESEDEGHESELLLTDGTYRTYIKSETECPGRSRVDALVARDEG